MGKEKRWAELKQWTKKKQKLFVRQNKNMFFYVTLWYGERMYRCRGRWSKRTKARRKGILCETSSSDQPCSQGNAHGTYYSPANILYTLRPFFSNQNPPRDRYESRKIGKMQCVFFSYGKEPKSSRSLIFFCQNRNEGIIFYYRESSRDMWVGINNVNLLISFAFILFSVNLFPRHLSTL